ncbi:MAG: putative metal-binding motif-containing protein, partial [Polaribacter sp.]|nr:putative metal-binding motif-containing protein [Polaribacter sp.]
VWYIGVDTDGDTFIVSTTSLTLCESPGVGYSLIAPTSTFDCDDNNKNINPGIIEVFGDGIDNNCDGQIDELQIGQFRDGGIVYIIYQNPRDADGDGILEIAVICAVEDQTDTIGIQWGPDGLLGLYNGNGLDGSRFTDAIIAAHGMSNAAGLARSYTGGGYTDWFLPGELDVHDMKTEPVYSIINAASLINGGSTLNGLIYWSSTEYSAQEAVTNLYGGNFLYFNTRPKSSLHSVRAVRYLKI